MNNFIIALLNRYLECDPEISVGLKQISEKVISIHINELNVILNMQVIDDHLQEVDDAAEADVTINVSLQALPSFLMGVESGELIKKGDIEITGDTHIASVFQNTLKQVEIDWEEHLAKYTGDTVAYQAGKVAKTFGRFARDLRNNVRLDMKDYLQDEMQVVPTKNEIDDFIADVDTLRADVDRLEARLKRLH